MRAAGNVRCRRRQVSCHDGRVQSDPRRVPLTPVLARRALMASAGTAALLATAGCNPFSTQPKITRTVTAALPPTADSTPILVATTRLHLVRLTNAIAADPALAGRLTPIREDRRAHLNALIAELGRTSPQAAAAEKEKPTADPTIAVPSAAVLLLAAVRSDATQAQGMFIDALSLASKYRAALFGSIAACLASHREALK